MISIIVPTYNRAHLVTETIDSILQQTYQDFELIIVDNFSRDDTESVLKRYADKRIRYFRHDNGGIVAVNRNYGMFQAKGEYIAFCDDDDVWLPDKLEKQVQEFGKDDRLGLVCTNATIFNETGDLRPFYPDRLPDAKFTLKSLVWSNLVICSSVMVKKSVIDDIGVMDTSPGIFTAEDYELWLRIARKYIVKYIDLPLVKYRIHPENIKKKYVATIRHNRAVYRKLLDKKVIRPPLYLLLNLRALAMELLLGILTIKPVSWLGRLICHPLRVI